MPFNQDFVASLSYSFGKDYSYHALLFKQSSQTKEVQLKDSGFGIGAWYENSIIMVNAVIRCLEILSI